MWTIMPWNGVRACCFFAFAAISAVFANHTAAQQTTLLVDVDHRPSTSLGGPWHYIVDPYRGGWGNDPHEPSLSGYAKNAHYVPGGPLQEYEFSKSPTLDVPGDWNSQKDSLFFYEGLLWYQRDFTYHKKPRSHLFLHVGAANYAADIIVNDVHVCHHEGGFTPFDCEIGNAVKDGDNFVVVAVDDQRTIERVPTLKTDWWNYGGLTREVSLVEVPEAYIDDYSLQLKRGTNDRLEGYAHVVGASEKAQVSVNIPGLKVTKKAVVDAEGRAAFSFNAPGLELWSPEHPRLYSIELKTGDDTLQDDIGFRTIEVQGDQILLNGKPIFLRGINAHAEAPYRSGRAWSEQDARTLLGWTLDLHCNFIRLAHYPHDEHMTRLADKFGIMVWSEIPVYWDIDWTNPPTLEIAKQQLHEMIRRDHNKASVILWSMSNETPISEARTAFIHELTVQARHEDPTRLITSAVVTQFSDKTATLDDPLGADLDVLGYNEYIGWYMDEADNAPRYTWIDPLHKPVIISEFGGEAVAGVQGSVQERFTEEHQANLYRRQILMFKKMPFLRGLAPWVLMDFRSPTRQLPGVQDYYNRKGLVSEKAEKKTAFYILKDYYEHM